MFRRKRIIKETIITMRSNQDVDFIRKVLRKAHYHAMEFYKADRAFTTLDLHEFIIDGALDDITKANIKPYVVKIKER